MSEWEGASDPPVLLLLTLWYAMSEVPKYKPPGKRPKAVSWATALAGLLFLNLAVYSFRWNAHVIGWVLLIAGIALIAFAVWWMRGAF